MKKWMMVCAPLFVIAPTARFQQRVVAECTVTYSIAADDVTDQDVAASLKATTKTVYIKANECRNDLVSPAFSQSVIYSKSNGSTTILREFGNNKFMTRMDNSRWLTENKKYDGMKFSSSNETKTILGYDCRKATIQLTDGSAYTLFYATNIIPSVREFEYQFRDVPGFVLEYESQDADGKKIKYTATKINLSPVQASRFDIPTAGYRLLN